MQDQQLVLISSWASIASLVVSIISLLLVRSIKANIIRFRRKQRLRELKNEVVKATQGALSSAELESLFHSLQRNFPISAWSKFSSRGKLLIELHQEISQRNLAAVKDVLRDMDSFTEDI